MNDTVRDRIGGSIHILGSGLVLAILVMVAFTEYRQMGLVRRTFVFYSLKSGEMLVEERMLRTAASSEEDIRRYVEEALLGPGSPDTAFLFPRETKLRSLFYRDGVVFVDLSREAVSFMEGGNSWRDFNAFYAGIRRNFPYIGEVKLFANGRVVFNGEFHLKKMKLL